MFVTNYFKLVICFSLLVKTVWAFGPEDEFGNNYAKPNKELINEVSISTDEKFRYFSANGIPDHRYGKFPNRNNPHEIKAQNYEFKVALQPYLSGEVTSVAKNLFGIALNGVVFDPATNEYWQNDKKSGWQYSAFSRQRNLGVDRQNAHVQPNGAYHYHGLPRALLRKRRGQPKLIGYAADGFPIYGLYGYKDKNDKDSEVIKLVSSYQLKQGLRPADSPKGKYDGNFIQDYYYEHASGDLDRCNGRSGITNEYPEGTYYYVITEAFPYVPRCFKGTPDKSFINKKGSGRNLHQHYHYHLNEQGDKRPRLHQQRSPASFEEYYNQ